ncbi:MAG: hypothetical protein JWL71_2288 [Acidobacteria bacterium]|nr:hypothetical protein [Acidobacteriota bacterium]
MTDRLYYTDPYLRAFDATVASVAHGADRLAITLDRTAFYPTSGGQPFDTGLLGGLRVVDVIEDDAGTITHVVDPRAPHPEPRTNLESGTPTVEPGQRVRGEIDWARRFDHMQQHSGQHVLSAAFDRLFTVRTVSFHLGAAVSTIDLARQMTPAEIAAAEDEANRVVWEDRAVTIRFADAEEAARLPLRKEPARGGVLRLIDVDGFDLSACGGTHVSRSGGIGVIAVASWERFKGGQRLAFVCGGRALGSYRALRDAMSASVRQLSVLPGELPAAIERLQGDAKDQKRALAALHAELARYRAEELAATAEPLMDAEGKQTIGRLVASAIDADAAALKHLASAIVARPGLLVVLTSTSIPGLVVIARSIDVCISAEQLLTKVVAELGGRGGGKADFAQGGGVTAPPEVVFNVIRTQL